MTSLPVIPLRLGVAVYRRGDGPLGSWVHEPPRRSISAAHVDGTPAGRNSGTVVLSLPRRALMPRCPGRDRSGSLGADQRLDGDGRALSFVTALSTSRVRQGVARGEGWPCQQGRCHRARPQHPGAHAATDGEPALELPEPGSGCGREQGVINRGLVHHAAGSEPPEPPGSQVETVVRLPTGATATASASRRIAAAAYGPTP
jgi:hypothetical protein